MAGIGMDGDPLSTKDLSTRFEEAKKDKQDILIHIEYTDIDIGSPV